MEELKPGALIYVTAYPVAWRVEVVNDGLHRGFEYLRSMLLYIQEISADAEY